METLLRDLRYALRTMGRSPAFTTIAVGALALGIGANTAIFTVVESILLRPLPYADPERLVVALHDGSLPVSPADYLDYQREARSFEQLGAAQAWSGNLRGGERTESIPGIQVSANLFPLLGVPPMLGRWVTGRDELVLSHKLWQRSFGGDTSVVGRTVALDGKAYTVTGVMPRSFQFAPFWATQAEMWSMLPLTERLNDRAGRSLRVFARLRSGVTLQQAQTEMDALASRLAAAYPRTNAKLGIRVVPLTEKVVGSVRPMLLVLCGTVGFVLLIACANVANLMLARAVGRRKEMALRVALGAGQGRLLGQLLTESLAVATAGGAAGLALALWGVHGLIALLPPGSMPRQQEIGFDGAAFLFAMAATLVTGIVSGMAPAIRLSRAQLNEDLKTGAGRTRGFLVSVEVALALILLIGSGLTIRTVQQLNAIDPGFRPANLLTFTVSTGGTPYATATRRKLLFEAVRDRLTQMPGVESVSAINHLPIGGDVWGLNYRIPGRPEPPAGDQPGAIYRVVLPGYFGTVGIAIERGRDFSQHDNPAAPAVAIINETLARKQWPGTDPIGQQIEFADDQIRTIVAVARDARQSDWTSPIREEIYLPYLQRTNAMGLDYLTFVVRTRTHPANMAQAVQTSITAIDRGIPASKLMSMEQVIADRLWRSRLAALLMGCFAAVALLLATMGIYGVISYSVGRRTKEIGIRMALGAGRGNVLGLALREGMQPVVAGALAGLAAAAAGSRWIASLLYGVKPTDPLTYVLVTVLFLSIAALANYIPALRAARVDPLTALRHE